MNVDIFNFGSLAIKTKIPEHIINRLYSEAKKELTNYNKNLAGHLNNQFLYNEETIKWFYVEMTPFWNLWREQHCNFHTLKNEHVDLSAIDLWVNFMKPGDFNPIHTHGGDISFVVYLDVPEELKKEANEYTGTGTPPGCIEFQFMNQQRPKWCTTGKFVLPETGDILIFPAMLQHTVLPFKSNVTRVSVSGNLAISNKEKLGNDYF